MSDTAQGPGWWQASDGLWYPPQAPPTPSGYAEDVLPSGPPPGVAAPTAGKATATLVLGILSFFTCPITAIIALVVASQANRQINESYGRLGGEGLVKTGRILAIINLALAVVTIPLMTAIAIPTFLGAKERAQDRSVQSELRNALTAEKVIAVDPPNAFTDDPAQLAGIEPSLRYEQGLQPVERDVIYVVVREGALGLSGRSASGTCFYVFAPSPTDDNYGYAEDEGCGSIEAQDFRTTWE